MHTASGVSENSFPNRNAPLLYLDPRTGAFVPLCQYVAIGSLSVFLLDLVCSVKDDYLHICRRKFGVMSVAFLVSRVTCLIFLIVCCLVLVTPLGDRCENAISALMIVYVFYRASTCSLFYARVKAVYSDSIPVKITFALLWCFAVGGAISILFSLSAVSIGPTAYCIPRPVGIWELVFMVAGEGIYNLSVCLAVMIKLRDYRRDEDGEVDGFWHSWLCNSSGRHRLADRFLRDSQTYFVITACMKIPEVIMILFFLLVARTSSGISIVLIYPDAAITNIIATKIYRNMKLRRPGLLPLQRSGMVSTFANLGGRSYPFTKFSFFRATLINNIPLAELEVDEQAADNDSIRLY